MRRKRFVVECVWSGYHSGQSRPCHRTVETYGRDKYEKLHSIRFTDGTYMDVSVRDCAPREKVTEIHGYDRLFDKILAAGLEGSPSVMDVNF